MDTAMQAGRSRDQAGNSPAPRASLLQHNGAEVQREAQELSRLLGATSDRAISPGVWHYFGKALGWPRWLFEGTGIAENQGLPEKVTVAQDLRLAANVLSNLGRDEAFALLLAHPLSTMGPFAQLIAGSAPSLQDAIVTLLSFVNSQNPTITVQIEAIGAELAVVVHSQVPPGELQSFLTFSTLTALHQFVMTNGCDPGQIRIETTYPIELPRSPAWSALKCPIACGAAQDRLVIPLTLASLPNRRSDPELWVLAQERCRQLEAGSQDAVIEKSIREQVRFDLRQNSGVPRLKHIAAEANVSERTLIRALQSQGTSFHTIVDDERRRAALVMIKSRQVSLAKIASALGFSSQSSFGRTFKSWTGLSPGEFRRRELSS